MKKVMSQQQIQLFTSADGQAQLQVALEHETVWLSLQQLTELFARDKSVISRHLKNIFDSNELQCESVVAKKATTKDFLVVRQEGAWQVRWGAFAKADPNNPHDVLMQKRVRSRQNHLLNMSTFALSDPTHG